jgi:hypothetical protein
MAMLVGEEIAVLKDQSRPITPQAFWELSVKIEHLEAAIPLFSGTVEARAEWMGRGLRSFEKSLVIPVEERKEGWNERVWHCEEPKIPELLMTHAQIREYLRMRYLKDQFPRIYLQAMGLLQRLAKAFEGFEGINDRWYERGLKDQWSRAVISLETDWIANRTV